LAHIAWRIQWRGREWEVRWENGTLTGGAAAEAFARFAVSNAPETVVALEQRLQSVTAMREIMPQFADAVLSEQSAE